MLWFPHRVADALLLARVIESVWGVGWSAFTTSNRFPPGRQRALLILNQPSPHVDQVQLGGHFPKFFPQPIPVCQHVGTLAVEFGELLPVVVSHAVFSSGFTSRTSTHRSRQTRRANFSSRFNLVAASTVSALASRIR